MMNAQDFLKLSPEERRRFMAEGCSKMSDEEVAEDVMHFLGDANGQSFELVLKQMTRIVSDIRAGERLRVKRAQ